MRTPYTIVVLQSRTIQISSDSKNIFIEIKGGGRPEDYRNIDLILPNRNIDLILPNAGIPGVFGPDIGINLADILKEEHRKASRS